jgi:hypothetical protein
MKKRQFTFFSLQDSDSCGVSIVVARVREGIIANNLRNHDLL